MLHIVAIGDSIIEGVGAANNYGWVFQFADRLRMSVPQLRLTNNGVSGSTTHDWIAQLKGKCLELAPDVVILGIGTNDSRYRPSMAAAEIPIELFTDNLSEIFRAIRCETKAMVILAGLTPVIDNLIGPYEDFVHRRSFQLAYERALYETAAREHALYVENFARWLSRGEDFAASCTTDGLHPNDRGHSDIAHYAFELFCVHSRNVFVEHPRP